MLGHMHMKNVLIFSIMLALGTISPVINLDELFGQTSEWYENNIWISYQFKLLSGIKTIRPI